VRRFLAGLVVIVWGALVARDASAYCRSSTCQPSPELGIQGAQCNPAQETDCGTPLKWQRECIGFTVNEKASQFIPIKTARKLLAQAFKTWEETDCGKGGPGIHAVDMGTVECDRVEYEPRAGNANILIFRDEGWQENGYDKLALTTVNFDKDTGEIWNADIEVNTSGYHYIQGTDNGDSDLLGVLTHEVGHFLGLAHTRDTAATMYDTYHDGMADLTEDDTLGICAVYPPKEINETSCNPIPRHGFSPLCASDQTEGRCSVAEVEQPDVPRGTPVLPIAAAVSLFLLRRRGRRASVA
jgi:hypothetical protein